MIPAPGVTFLDYSTNIVETGNELSVWLSLSDGSLVGVCVPLAELIRRGHTIVEAADAPAFCAGPVLQ